MSFINVQIHAVFSTKYRSSCLTEHIRKNVFDHIKENCNAKKIRLHIVNGFVDHAHCLFSLKATQTIAEILNAIKGESAHWINKNNLIQHHFNWQKEYWASSVDPKYFHKVYDYIANQEKHHQKNDFLTELDVLIKRFDFKKYSDDFG